MNTPTQTRPTFRLQGNNQFRDLVTYPEMRPYRILVQGGHEEDDLPTKEQVLAAVHGIFQDEIEIVEHRTRGGKKMLILGIPKDASRDAKDIMMSALN